MKVQVVGVREVDYVSKKDNSRKMGIELHLVDLSTKKKDLHGSMVMTQYISSESQFYEVPIQVGGVYTLYKNGYEVDYFKQEEDSAGEPSK